MDHRDHYNIIKTFREIFKRLPAKRKKQFWILLSGMIVAGGFETVTLGIIALFVTSVANPAAVLHSSYIKILQGVIPFAILDNLKGLILLLSAVVVIMVICKNIIADFINYASRRYSAYAASYLGEQVLSGFLKIPYEWHLSRNTADLALGVFWRQFLGNFVSAVLMALCDITIVIIVLWAIFIVEPVVSMMVAGVLGISAFIIFSRVRRLLDLTLKKLRDYRQEINRDVTKAMHGIKEVKVYGREDLFVEDYRKKAYAEARLDALQFFLGQSPQWILEALGFFMLSAAIYLMMFYMDFSEAKVTGMMALCAVAAWRILPSINKILGRLVNARSALPFVQKSLDYFHEIETARKAGVPMQKTALSYSFKNSIRFSNVLFKYDTAEADALNDINILIPKGKTVGIIGMSGAGKSTLVDLLIGLLHPTSGRVMIDEMELKHELTTSWLRIIGYVGQNPYICDGTLSENVAFGMKSDAIDSGRVLECCSMAAMGDFISDLPNGIDTQIGERGVMLSGGQRQRVAIARALYNKPDVLIFDEATSSLDTKSEKAIQNTIYSFKGKQTLIIIAHRLSTVEDCDEIIWLEKGSVRQIGTPKEILPIYKRYMQDEKPDIKQTEK